MGMLYSQDINADAISESGGITGSVGTVTINGQIYNQLSLRPEIPFGNLGVVLDLYLYFNDDGMYWESWDFSGFGPAYRTIIDKIYYLRWGHPGDDLYILAGALPSVTLGQGILVNNYSNIMEYPQVRQTGLNLQAKVSDVAVEVIHSNFKSATPGLLGLRGSYYILPKLNLGLSFVTDMNQLAGLQDSDGDDYPDYYDYYPTDGTRHDSLDYWLGIYATFDPDNEINPAEFDQWYSLNKHNNPYDAETARYDGISGFALDATYSLSEKITLYSQFAQLIGEINTTMLDPNFGLNKYTLGMGFVPIGVKAQLGPVKLRSEFRIASRRFLFNYWDRAYDVNRVIVDSKIITRESQLYQYGKLSGIYAYANMRVMNLANLGLGYQNMQGERWDDVIKKYKSGESNQTFLFNIGIIPSLIPKVAKVEAYYQNSNDPNPFDFHPTASTIWGYNLGIEVSSGVMLLYQARTTYISDLDHPGDFLPVKSLQIETQFIF